MLLKEEAFRKVFFCFIKLLRENEKSKKRKKQKERIMQKQKERLTDMHCQTEKILQRKHGQIEQLETS